MSQAVKDSICHTIWFNTVMYKVTYLQYGLYFPPSFHCVAFYFLSICISINGAIYDVRYYSMQGCQNPMLFLKVAFKLLQSKTTFVHESLREAIVLQYN